MPFTIATINNDNGGENEKDFADYLESEKVAQFFSRSGTPTDNPRVERSHLTDELEFYAQGNLYKNFNRSELDISLFYVIIIHCTLKGSLLSGHGISWQILF